MIRKLFKQRRGGYSLIETLIGLAILAIALSSSYALTINVRQIMARNFQRTAASNLAEQKLEELRNANYADIVSGYDGSTLDSLGNPGSTFNRSWNVEVDTPAAGLKRVTVYVSWQQSGGILTYDSYILAGVIGQ